MQRLLLVLGLLAFLAIEAVLVTRCVGEHGVMGALARAVEPVPLVIVVDFTFTSAAVFAWMARDAWARGRSPWPWLPVFALVPTLGLFLFLLARGHVGVPSGDDPAARP